MNESYQGPDRDTLAALRELDARIEALGTEIWVGAEPTFTDRHAESAEWLHMALGGEKERRAGELLRDFSRALPGCAFLRTLGRQYPGEARARWSFGVLARRDGCPIWEGPPDPLIVEAPCPRFELETLRRCLIEGARGRGWAAESCALACSGELRLLIRIEGGGAARLRRLRGSVAHEGCACGQGRARLLPAGCWQKTSSRLG